MAYALPETGVWAEVVRGLEANAVLTGGPECPDNLPLIDLANRTAWLMQNSAKKADFNYSFGASGFQKLSSGLILQWANGQQQGSTNTPDTNSFPIAFPNAVLCLVASCSHVASAQNVSLLALGLTKTSYQTIARYGNGAVATGEGWSMVAIGY